MDISEAAQRIFRVRGLVIVACLIGGLAVGYGVHRKFETTTYTASARLVTTGSVPQTADWASALAGTVEGIVTSPDRLTTALADAGATRDIVKFTKEVITQSLSGSSVLELSVTDANAAVATAVANTLAADAVEALTALQQQPSQLLVNGLQAQIDPLASTIAGIDSRLTSTGLTSAQIEALVTQRTDLSQQMTALMTKRADVEQQMVQSVGASVVAPAVWPLVPDPSRLPLDLILGALASLIIGVALAVLLEMLRPTLVGRAAIERALGAPVLGVMTRDGGDLSVLSKRLQRAAERAKMSTVVLWHRDEDLSDVARRLQGAKPALVGAGRPSFTVRAAVPGEPLTPRWGLVVVVPLVVPLRTIEKADELRTDDGLSVLGGIIRHRRRRARWLHRRSGAPRKVVPQVDEQVEDAGEQPSAVLVS
jgi:capsular polysaccharide biosynthesis protein